MLLEFVWLKSRMPPVVRASLPHAEIVAQGERDEKNAQSTKDRL
jgi:hypothetical protein